jgi:hypothetical protein
LQKPGPVPIGILLLSVGILFTLFMDSYYDSSVQAFIGNNGTVWVSLFCLGSLIASTSLFFFVRRFGVVGTVVVILPLSLYWYVGATAPFGPNSRPLMFLALLVLTVFSPLASIAGLVVRRGVDHLLRNQ